MTCARGHKSPVDTCSGLLLCQLCRSWTFPASISACCIAVTTATIAIVVPQRAIAAISSLIVFVAIIRGRSFGAIIMWKLNSGSLHRSPGKQVELIIYKMWGKLSQNGQYASRTCHCQATLLTRNRAHNTLIATRACEILPPTTPSTQRALREALHWAKPWTHRREKAARDLPQKQWTQHKIALCPWSREAVRCWRLGWIWSQIAAGLKIKICSAEELCCWPSCNVCKWEMQVCAQALAENLVCACAYACARVCHVCMSRKTGRCHASESYVQCYL